MKTLVTSIVLAILTTTTAQAGFFQWLEDVNKAHAEKQAAHFADRASRTDEVFFSDANNFYIVIDGQATIISRNEAASQGSEDNVVKFIERKVLENTSVDGAVYDGKGWHFANDEAREKFLDARGRIKPEDIPSPKEIREATKKSIEEALASPAGQDAKAAALAAGDARTAATKAQIKADRAANK